MGINVKIMDKIVLKCKKDVELRVLITELLKVESDKLPQYKETYRKLIEFQAKEAKKNEDN